MASRNDRAMSDESAPVACLFCDHDNAAERTRCLYCGAPLADGSIETPRADGKRDEPSSQSPTHASTCHGDDQSSR
jgi:hypothetical protein